MDPRQEGPVCALGEAWGVAWVGRLDKVAERSWWGLQSLDPNAPTPKHAPAEQQGRAFLASALPGGGAVTATRRCGASPGTVQVYGAGSLAPLAVLERELLQLDPQTGAAVLRGRGGDLERWALGPEPKLLSQRAHPLLTKQRHNALLPPPAIDPSGRWALLRPSEVELAVLDLDTGELVRQEALPFAPDRAFFSADAPGKVFALDNLDAAWVAGVEGGPAQHFALPPDWETLLVAEVAAVVPGTTRLLLPLHDGSCALWDFGRGRLAWRAGVFPAEPGIVAGPAHLCLVEPGGAQALLGHYGPHLQRIDLEVGRWERAPLRFSEHPTQARIMGQGSPHTLLLGFFNGNLSWMEEGWWASERLQGQARGPTVKRRAKT